MNELFHQIEGCDIEDLLSADVNAYENLDDLDIDETYYEFGTCKTGKFQSLLYPLQVCLMLELGQQPNDHKFLL